MGLSRMKLGFVRAGYRSAPGGFSCAPIFAAFSLGPQPNGSPATSPKPHKPNVLIKLRRAQKIDSGVILRSGICHLGGTIIAAIRGECSSSYGGRAKSTIVWRETGSRKKARRSWLDWN